MPCRDSGPDMPGLLIFQEKQILKFTTLLNQFATAELCFEGSVCDCVCVGGGGGGGREPGMVRRRGT